jgi:hypothetical protein
MAYKEVRQTLSKIDSKCKDCKTEIKKHTPCIVEPKKKDVYCLTCGKKIKS